MHRERATAVVMAGLALVLILGVLYFKGPTGGGWFPACAFHQLTGLDCPGCGMTRATHAVLHGRFVEAFGLNPLGMLALPLVLVVVGSRIPAWVSGKPQAWKLELGRRTLWVVLAVVFSYWILRNIPVWPFTLLGPQ